MAGRARGSGSRLLKAVADQFPQDVISESDAVRAFFDTLMKETGGYVIIDFLDCGNWDGLAGYDYDPEKGYLYLYWRDYRKDDASGRRRPESRMVFPGSLYGLFLHLQKVEIIRGTDSVVFLLHGYSLTSKDVRRILAAGAEEFELKEDSLFATHVFRKMNGQWQLLQVHTAPLYGAVIVPKGVGAPSVASRKLLFDANLRRVLGRLTAAYQVLEKTPDSESDAIAEKGNTIRRALEQALKIEICYRDMEVKKPYSQLLLGDLLALLKDYQEEDGFKIIYGKLAEWANELSHDTGRPVKQSNALLLAIFSIAYVEMLRLSTSLDPFPPFTGRMLGEVDRQGNDAEASPATDDGTRERPGGSMLFTVELDGLGVRYRQLEDGSWRRLGKNKSLAKGDFRTDGPRVVASRSPGFDTSINLDGTDFKVNPSQATLGDNVLGSASTCFR